MALPIPGHKRKLSTRERKKAEGQYHLHLPLVNNLITLICALRVIILIVLAQWNQSSNVIWFTRIFMYAYIHAHAHTQPSDLTKTKLLTWLYRLRYIEMSIICVSVWVCECVVCARVCKCACYIRPEQLPSFMSVSLCVFIVLLGCVCIFVCVRRSYSLFFICFSLSICLCWVRLSFWSLPHVSLLCNTRTHTHTHTYTYRVLSSVI